MIPDWDGFDTELYFRNNYGGAVREHNSEIISLLCSWCSRHASSGGTAIDVGTGGSLCGPLAVSPYVDRVILTDVSESNRQWISAELASSGQRWIPYIEGEVASTVGLSARSLWNHFADVSEVQAMDIDRPSTSGADVATMLFVAESSTDDVMLLKRRLHSFAGLLKNGGLGLCAAMLGSEGYSVGGVRYPAVALELADLVSALEDADVDVIESRTVVRGAAPVRSGYSGMAVLAFRA